ncbi:MAG: fumarylacetoacetate hydrolase family protein [Calditrichaeota bacterium]|nr:MAG: fumarylacetoacetate hydrolase family protein [Calditrichota bacterium]
MLELLNLDAGLVKTQEIYKAITEGRTNIHISDSTLTAPITNPPSCRDAYAFRQHVATARRNRGVPMIPEFDSYPVFYFTNHNAIYGSGEIIVENDHLLNLDFELEAAVVIGKKGKNIQSADADKYIAGYTIMNDFSARQLQMEEMKLSLGPAKGKDFATAIGPYIVTPDELEKQKITTDFGDKYNLKMQAFHNGKKISSGNLKDMNWTFAEIIERVSYGAEIYPGDVIGSGTVGTGCYLELNGTAALEAQENGENFTPIWLQAGDKIELTIEGLGRLSNTIKKSDANHSILAKKKDVI